MKQTLIWLTFHILLAMPVLAAVTTTIKEKNGLPDATHWRHRPVFVKAGDDTDVIGVNENEPLPLGVPFEFESPLFKGTMLLRFRHAKSDDKASHKSYFDGRKRLMQTVVQGRFKKPTQMSDVYVGSVFEHPLAGPPPPFFTRIMDAVIRRVAPGVILDLASNRPKVLALYAGTAQTVSIDEPGNEPAMKERTIPENVASYLGAKFKSPKQRKKILSCPSRASQFEFDTHHVYTFHTYDHAMDYGRGSIRVPMYGDYDIKPTLGPQPLSLSAVTKDGGIFYSFEVWHEKTPKESESHQHNGFPDQ